MFNSVGDWIHEFIIRIKKSLHIIYVANSSREALHDYRDPSYRRIKDRVLLEYKRWLMIEAKASNNYDELVKMLGESRHGTPYREFLFRKILRKANSVHRLHWLLYELQWNGFASDFDRQRDEDLWMKEYNTVKVKLDKFFLAQIKKRTSTSQISSYFRRDNHDSAYDFLSKGVKEEIIQIKQRLRKKDWSEASDFYTKFKMLKLREFQYLPDSEEKMYLNELASLVINSPDLGKLETFLSSYYNEEISFIYLRCVEDKRTLVSLLKEVKNGGKAEKIILGRLGINLSD